jgi:hypothetical protein
MMGVAKKRPESIRGKANKILGVRLFKRAPAGFNPVTAKARELLVYGYPARPDVKRHPQLNELWEKMLSRPIRFIDPKFSVMKDKGHGPRPKYALPSGLGWCGSIARPASGPKGGTVSFVSGQWTVPHIVAPSPGDCICACWVGIDGGNEDSDDILQAGTTQMLVDRFGFLPEYVSFAWFEWYPAPPVTIANFPVSPGDTMYCTICANSPTEAVIRLLNVTSGVATVFMKTAPAKIQLAGDTVEWVVEAPIDANMNLARFGDVYFDASLAGTNSGQLILAGGGALVPMYDVHGNVISKASSITGQLIKVEYSDTSS